MNLLFQCQEYYLLSFIIWLPIFAGVLLFFIRNNFYSKLIALIFSFLGFLITLPLYFKFKLNSLIQFEEYHQWIPNLNLHYHLGIDGISVLFIILNSFITFLVILSSFQSISKKVYQYMAAFLIMSGLINGAFASLDAILFYIFFEAMLIPMYLIIGIWGGPRRVYASIKFFLYTLLGSLLMLVALIYLSKLSLGSFEILDMQNIKAISLNIQILLFIAFFMSFAVKIPMWPVHTWLPDAHVEAPTGGSMVLAAITLKIGAYGFLRFVLPILPDASRFFAPYIIILSLTSVIYIGLVALVQGDMKKLVAYSSISHMGFVTLGLFLFSSSGTLYSWLLKGSIIQMISHGFVSAAMFMSIGVLYDRIHTRKIMDYGGVINKMPHFSAFMLLFSMANSGLPGTSGFVGEFMVIMGSIKINFWIGVLAGIALILGASYNLWMYKRVVFGDVANENVEKLTDINKREFFILFVLSIAVLSIGIFPEAIVKIIEYSSDNLIQQILRTKLI